MSSISHISCDMFVSYAGESFCPVFMISFLLLNLLRQKFDSKINIYPNEIAFNEVANLLLHIKWYSVQYLCEKKNIILTKYHFHLHDFFQVLNTRNNNLIAFLLTFATQLIDKKKKINLRKTSRFNGFILFLVFTFIFFSFLKCKLK